MNQHTIRQHFNELRTLPSRLEDRGRRDFQWLRHRGEAEFWRVQVEALTFLERELVRAESAPLISRITVRAHSRIRARLKIETSLPIDEFDTLTAKEASREVKSLEPRMALVRLRHHEAAHKARKTVLGAIEEALDALDARPEPVASPEVVADAA